MSDDGLKTEVSVGAKIDEALAAIAQLTQQFKRFSDDTKAQMDKVGQATDLLLSKFKALVAGFLSVEGIRRSIDATREFVGEANKLANQMGIDRASASQFAVAINDVGVSVDEVGSIIQRQGRNLRTHEDAMNQMGVKTRDANGHLLGQQEIFLNSLEVLREYKVGTDRNQAAMVVFGGRVGDVSKLLRINNDVIEEGRKKADALGLTLTESSVRGAKEFKQALNDAGDVSLGFKKVIGDAVMPVLADVLRYFSDYGPEAIKVFSLAFRTLVTAVDYVWLALKTLMETVRNVVQSLTVMALTIADVLANLFNPEKAKEAWKRGMEQIEQINAETLQHMEAAQKAFDQRQKDRWGDPVKAGKPAGGTKSFVQPATLEERAAELDAQAKMGKTALSTYEEMLSQEVAAKRMKEAEKTELMRTATLNQFNLEKYVLEQKMALYAHEPAKVKAFQAELKLAQAQYYLDDLKLAGQTEQAKEKQREELAARQIQANQARVSLMEAQGELQKQVWAEEVATGRITAQQRLELERTLLQQIHDAKMAAWEQERELLKNKEKEQERVSQQMAQEEVKHATEMRKNQMSIVDEMLAKWKTLGDGITSAFGTMVKGVLMGTQTLSQGLRNFAGNVLGVFLDLGAKMLAAEAMKWLKMKVMGEEAQGASVASALAAAVAQKAIAIPSAIADITRSAAVTFAGVFANLAPFLGPLAAEPAAAAQGAVLAQIPAASFDVGSWSVPRDMLAQIHQGEMIIPRGFANEMRDAGGGALGGVGLTYNDYSGKLTDTEIDRNARKLALAVGKHLRNLGL